MAQTFSIELSVRDEGTTQATVVCTARNLSGRTLHVFASRRLPYLLEGEAAEGGGLVVLHGVHPPPEDRDLNLIEIPSTRPIAAGETLSFEAALAPPSLRGHYGDEPAPPRTAEPVPLVCKLGYGETPISEEDRTRLSIHDLLRWQILQRSAPRAVRLL